MLGLVTATPQGGPTTAGSHVNVSIAYILPGSPTGRNNLRTVSHRLHVHSCMTSVRCQYEKNARTHSSSSLSHRRSVRSLEGSTHLGWLRSSRSPNSPRSSRRYRVELPGICRPQLPVASPDRLRAQMGRGTATLAVRFRRAIPSRRSSLTVSRSISSRPPRPGRSNTVRVVPACILAGLTRPMCGPTTGLLRPRRPRYK